MRGIYRSFKRIENETIRRIDAKRKNLNCSASKLAKQHRQERNIALFALAKEGVLRVPGPSKLGPGETMRFKDLSTPRFEGTWRERS
jgi:hypothetical protein